jgi:hypothetical protein
MFSEDALRNRAYIVLFHFQFCFTTVVGTPPRTCEDHRRLAEEYKALAPKDRAKFVKQHGVRWTEFARLHYFDPVRMVIIDPMHCIILGINFSFLLLRTS